MIYKAIIEEIIDEYTVRVRVPLIHRTVDSHEHTATEDLPIAVTCTLPNTYISMQKGDIVIVGFENNDLSKPIVLGYLYKEVFSSSMISPKFFCLEVVDTATLGKNTSIGDVTPLELQRLAGLRENLQYQLDILYNKIEEVEKSIPSSPTNKQ